MATLIEAVQSALSTAKVKNSTLIDWPEEKAPATKIFPYAALANSSLQTGIQRVQIMSRASTYATAESESWLAYKALVAIRGKQGTVWGNRSVFSIRPIQEPYFLGRDERDRYVMVFNIEIEAAWSA